MHMPSRGATVSRHPPQTPRASAVQLSANIQFPFLWGVCMCEEGKKTKSPPPLIQNCLSYLNVWPPVSALCSQFTQIHRATQTQGIAFDADLSNVRAHAPSAEDRSRRSIGGGVDGRFSASLVAHGGLFSPFLVGPTVTSACVLIVFSAERPCLVQLRPGVIREGDGVQTYWALCSHILKASS